MEIGNKLKGLFDTPEHAVGTLNRFGPPLVCLLLVALIASMLASVTLALLPRPEAQAPPPSRNAQPQQAAAASVNVQDIVQRHLFGIAPVKEAAPQSDIDPENIPETRLPMTLVGTLASDNTDRSLAIIESGNEAKVYAIGDTIQSRVTLDAVRAKEVFIINNGKRETLALPREEEGSSAPRRTTRTASRSRTTSRRATPSRATAISASTGAKTLGDLIRPQPVFANGKQRGYRIYPGRQRDQFAALGLKAGDLVTEINGTPLDDPSRGKDIFGSLASASQISVTIERNGSPTSLVLDTSQLNLSGEQ
ncbi:MAG: type II secretion system protein GspC [Gammaproteobacteria bacterium]